LSHCDNTKEQSREREGKRKEEGTGGERERKREREREREREGKIVRQVKQERGMDRVTMDIEILHIEMLSAERVIKKSVTLHLCACLCTCLSACMHACTAVWLTAFYHDIQVNRKYSRINNDINDIIETLETSRKQ